MSDCTSCANQGYCPQENKDMSEDCMYYVSTDVDSMSILEYLEDLRMRQKEYMSVVQEQGNLEQGDVLD